MKKLYILILIFCLAGCKNTLEQVTATTVSVYLNASNCSIYDKIMSGALADHQIIFLESAPVFSLFKSRQADGELLKFFINKYQEQNGILSEEDRKELASLQSAHISWANMTSETQKHVSDLVFNGCTTKS